MRIEKTKKGKVIFSKHASLNRYDYGVSFKTESHDDRKNVYSLMLNPLDYLSVAKKCIEELESVSGMSYCIMAKHPNGEKWRAI